MAVLLGMALSMVYYRVQYTVAVLNGRADTLLLNTCYHASLLAIA